MSTNRSSSSGEIKINPECIFCGRKTNQTQRYMLSQTNGPIWSKRSPAIKVRIPAHKNCFEKAESPAKHDFLLLIVTFAFPLLAIVLVGVFQKSIQSLGQVYFFPILLLSVVFPFIFVGTLYKKAGQARKDLDNKIKEYCDSHPVG